MSGRKNDTDKPPMSLLDRYALEQIANVLAFGAKKYAKHNWRKGLEYSRLLDAALRHLLAFADGEDNDPESGLSHIAHAGCCVMFLLWMSKNRTDLDDRHKSCRHGAFQNYNGVRYCHHCDIRLPKDQQPKDYIESHEHPATNPYKDCYTPVDPDLVKPTGKRCNSLFMPDSYNCPSNRCFKIYGHTDNCEWRSELDNEVD